MNAHFSHSNLSFPCHPCFIIIPDPLPARMTLLCFSLVSLPLIGFTLWVTCSPPLTQKTELLPINLLVTDLALHVLNLLTVAGIGSEHLFRIFWNVMITMMGLTRPFSQTMISVERFLAAAFPLLFLKYRPLRYRAKLLAAAWLVVTVICCAGIVMCESHVETINIYLVFEFMSFFIVLSINSICCGAILKVLLRTPPGDGGGASKGKEVLAFTHHTKTFLTVVLIESYMISCYLPPIVQILKRTVVEDMDFCRLHMQTLIIILCSSGVYPIHILYSKGRLNCLGKAWGLFSRTK